MTFNNIKVNIVLLENFYINKTNIIVNTNKETSWNNVTGRLALWKLNFFELKL